jgi:hypothetical protein
VSLTASRTDLTGRPASDAATVPLVWPALAGVALGVAYAASPLTVWFFVVVAALFAWSGRGLSRRERAWVWGLLAGAVMLRVAAVAILFLATDHTRNVSFFWDGDGLYLKQRSLWIRNMWVGNPLPPLYSYNAFASYGWTTYIFVLAYIQYLVGGSPYGLHLFNVALCMTTAVMLYRLVRPTYGQSAAVLGFALVLFLPTPFFWSVSALKESLFVFLAAVALAGAVTILRRGSLLTRAIAIALVVASVLAIDGVRTGGQVIVVVGLVSGLIASVIVRRATLVVVVLVVLAFGGYRLINHPTVQTRLMSQAKLSALIHIGNVRTEGHGYRLLDQRFYSGPNELLSTMTPIEADRELRHRSTPVANRDPIRDRVPASTDHLVCARASGSRRTRRRSQTGSGAHLYARRFDRRRRDDYRDQQRERRNHGSSQGHHRAVRRMVERAWWSCDGVEMDG